MKLSHAAAIGLLTAFARSKNMGKSWYLMTPPIEGATVNSSAPLSKWVIKQSFDSAASCEASLDANHEEAEKAWLHPETQQEPKDWTLPQEGWKAWVEANATQFLSAACVATDDPRLKTN